MLLRFCNVPGIVQTCCGLIHGREIVFYVCCGTAGAVVFIKFVSTSTDIERATTSRNFPLKKLILKRNRSFGDS